jgi:PleD family two-component response regulator
LTVTISIGLVDMAQCSDPASGLALADRRLYAAKTAGRNRVNSES